MSSGPVRPPSDEADTNSIPAARPTYQEAATLPPKDSATLPPVEPLQPTQPMKPTPRTVLRPTADQLPLALGRYRLTKLLGEGGMGSVYLAHDSQLDRAVALKIPQFGSDDNSNMRERFLREARAAAGLHHANICPVYDADEIDGTSYMTMAFIEGQSLAELLREQPHLPPKRIATLLRKVAQGLEEAHRKQVIHRDLKPGNIMLTAAGEPVVMDFGLARRGGTADARITQAGSVMGTPAYMAPEQASGIQEKIGPHCDIYSLGVILYEMLAGDVPFKGDTMGILTQVLLDEPPPPSKHRPDVDPQLEAICLKAMAKKPEARYRTMADMAAAFTAYLKDGESNEATVVTTAPPAAKPAGGISRWFVLAAAAVVAIVAGTGIFVYQKKFRKPDAIIEHRYDPFADVPFANTGRVNFRLSDPAARANVKIDGNSVDPAYMSGHIDGAGQLQFEMRLAPGDHTLELTGNKYKNVSTKFTVKRDGYLEFEIPLEPVAKVAATADAEKKQRAQEALAQSKVHLQKHENDKAVEVATKALDDDPNLADANMVRAAALAALGKWPEVSKDCTVALKADLKNFEAHILRSHARLHMQLFEGAITDCTEALRYDKKNVTALLNRGIAYAHKNDEIRALADFNDAIRLDAKNARAYLERGLIHAKKKDNDLARADFAKAVQLSPELAAKVPAAFAAPSPDTAMMWPADLLSAGKIAAPDLSKVKPLWSVKLDKPLDGLTVGKIRPNGEASFSEGKYTVHIPARGTHVSAVPHRWEIGHAPTAGIAIQIVASAKGNGSRWGISFHPRDDSPISERFEILLWNPAKLFIGPTPKGEEAMDAIEKTLIEHPALKRGAANSTLLVVARGRVVELYVNGEAVAQPIVLDREVHAPQFGLVAGSMRVAGVTAQFESITVWPVDSIPSMSKRGAVPKK